ncbi:MAG: DUF1957 domain-containing protein [Candidatus Eisenbacteria bacterium]|nr:DUF1957 domain-containing protein [Candidatus Eisenbacteria bacterium]
MRRTGELAVVLHCHLPFVRHPEYADFLEEDWLFEAISETYIPLLDMTRRLADDGVPFCINMSVTPPLAEMLADPLLQQRYRKGLEDRIELLGKEKERIHEDFRSALEMYHAHFGRCLEVFDGCGGSLIRLFRELQDRGVLEILTCGATHGFLPLMATDEARRAQIAVGANNYRKHFGRGPRGIWLPECAYLPGFERLLAGEGIDWFVLDAHGVLFGRPRPRYAVHAPVRCPNGVAVFARDMESSRQVWSRDEGYPGDFRYREFYRDLGYDGEYHYVRSYLGDAGIRKYLGIKYYRITGRVDLSAKEPYVPDWARQAAREHAEHFLNRRREQMRGLTEVLGRPPVVVAAFDAELFGHWWFEGPLFLESLIRRANEADHFSVVGVSDHLDRAGEVQTVVPEASSWGDKGYFEVWLRGVNDWIYRHLHHAERTMTRLARAHPDPDGLTRRALNQSARELLLAQSSDWAFLLAMGTASVYAEKRTRDHTARFLRLSGMIDAGRIDEGELGEMEKRDNIFAEIDYRIYAGGA